MKNEIALLNPLVRTIEEMQEQEYTYEDAAHKLFEYEYDDFSALLNLEKYRIESGSYLKIPLIFGRNYVAQLMLWGIDYATAIHDHQSYDGIFKVLKGTLSELTYRENANFIEFAGKVYALKNDIFGEEPNGIHSIVNCSDSISATLHCYRTAQLNLDGVRIFDTATRRIGWLSAHATTCSWDLLQAAFKKIQIL